MTGKFDGYILCAQIAHYPAQELRDSINKLAGLKLLVTHHPEQVKKNLFMRYGNYGKVKVKDTEWNSPEFIALCTQKRMFATLLLNNGMYAPEFTRRVPENNDYPLLVRETLTGFGGHGIHYVENNEEFNRVWNPHFWWTPFINLKYEMRAHIVNGVMIKLYVKKLLEEVPIRIMNNDNSHWVRVSFENKYSKLKELITQISTLTGGNFYGLDVGWDESNKNYFVLEANSAPGLNLTSSDEYASAILKGMGINVRTTENTNGVEVFAE